LRQSRAVAQDEEAHGAEVADAVHPALQTHGLARQFGQL
jgi:hypothetical protein